MGNEDRGEAGERLLAHKGKRVGLCLNCVSVLRERS